MSKISEKSGLDKQGPARTSKANAIVSFSVANLQCQACATLLVLLCACATLCLCLLLVLCYNISTLQSSPPASYIVPTDRRSKLPLSLHHLWFQPNSPAPPPKALCLLSKVGPCPQRWYLNQISGIARNARWK